MRVFIGKYPDTKKKRTIRIKIDKWDTWNADHTLALIIVPMLKQLKATKHGVPHVDDEDVPDTIVANPAAEDKEFSLLERRWDWIMDEMIWAFEQKTIDWEQQFYSGKSDPIWECTNPEAPEDEQFFEMKSGPNDTFEVDMEGMNTHQARMSRGFRLFGRYYEALWD